MATSVYTSGSILIKIYMLKDFFMKKMVESQMKGIPEEQKQKVLEMVSKNPEFFNKIAEEVKKEIDNGKDQMSATIEVVSRYKEELKKIL